MVTRQTRPYATARFSQAKLIREEHVPQPASEVHAKTVGSSSALCGQRTDTWFKFYALPFEVAPAPRCQKCAAALKALLSHVRGWTWGNVAQSGSWGAVGTFKVAALAALVCSAYVGIRCEPLRTVHPSVFAVLALESEPRCPEPLTRIRLRAIYWPQTMAHGPGTLR
jgi:hypothetical protein